MAVRADDVDLIRDRSLVELCQAGDLAAFGDLYSRYYQRLLRFCTRRVGDAHEAEEITQEAFARAFSAMPRFAGDRRFYPWLTVIAGRLCIDSHRRVSRTEPSAEVDLGGVEGGQQQIVDNVDLAYLGQAMAQLGPRHREVLELRESQGWSYQQIADHYGVTIGTVEALLFRARKALRREFVSIAGGDTRWAAAPVLGAVWRAAHSLRSRFEDLSSQAIPFAALGAASVAAVASGFAFAPAPIPASPVARHQVHVAEISATPRLQAVAEGGVFVGGPSPRAHNAAGEPAGFVPARSLTLATGSAAGGRARSSDDPTTLTVGPLVVATDLADPSQLTDPYAVIGTVQQ